MVCLDAFEDELSTYVTWYEYIDLIRFNLEMQRKTKYA